MKIRDLRFSPPGGWKFHEDRTYFWSQGITFEQMLGRVAQHRINMKFPIVNPPFATLAEEVQDWICQHLKEEDRVVHCEEPTKQNSGIQPGNIFSSVINSITGRYAVTCGRCMERMGRMNTWGWWGCWKHRAEIVQWMAEEAAGRGHHVSHERILSLFRAALVELRQSRKRSVAQANQAPH